MANAGLNLRTQLCNAVKSGDIAFIDECVDVFGRTATRNKNTATKKRDVSLIKAAKAGNAEYVQKLLRMNRIDVNAVDEVTHGIWK